MLRLSTVTFACHSAACRPPKSGGTGGSLPTPAGGSVPEKFDMMSGHTLFEAGIDSIVPIDRSGSQSARAMEVNDAMHNTDTRAEAKRRSEAAVTDEFLKDPKMAAHVRDLLDSEVRTDMVEEVIRGLSESGMHRLVEGYMADGRTLLDANGVPVEKPTLRTLISRVIETGNDPHKLWGMSLTLAQVYVNDWEKYSADLDTTNPERMVAQLLVRSMIKGWAETSIETATAALNQGAAAAVHGVPVTAALRKKIDKVLGDRPDLTVTDASREMRQGLVRAEYAVTQRFLDEALGPKVKTVLVLRGVANQHKTAEVGDVVDVVTHPLSSWTISRVTAVSFAKMRSTSPAGRKKSVVLAMAVPREMIQSTPFTGRGCLNEWEVVLIGRPSQAEVQVKGGNGEW